MRLNILLCYYGVQLKKITNYSFIRFFFVTLRRNNANLFVELKCYRY